jgi:predicted flap endonuclease-1-like 5' DNA nuclease
VPTPGEKKALLFLSLVAVLGAGARLVSANAVPVPSDAEVRALDGQIRAVDSVRRGQGAGGRGRRKARTGGGRSAAGADSATQRAEGSTKYALPVTLPPAVRPPPVDLDKASAAEMESLPGIGPALARRIAASRDSLGPFGSLDELQSRVLGVGPALAKRLAPAVTFSGPRSPPSAERTEPFGNGGTPARGKRRRGH